MKPAFATKVTWIQCRYQHSGSVHDYSESRSRSNVWKEHGTLKDTNMIKLTFCWKCWVYSLRMTLFGRFRWYSWPKMAYKMSQESDRLLGYYHLSHSRAAHFASTDYARTNARTHSRRTPTDIKQTDTRASPSKHDKTTDSSVSFWHARISVWPWVISVPRCRINQSLRISHFSYTRFKSPASRTSTEVVEVAVVVTPCLCCWSVALRPQKP